MEYGQEPDKIKTEVENFGKQLEDLSKSIQSLSGLAKLQESINDFQENNALSRVETKVDILAQTDYSELFDFSVNSLKDALSDKIENIQNSLSFVSEKLNNNSDFSQDLAFLKENFYKINDKFSEITHLIQTNTAENEELNNRLEGNITRFNSCFQNIYDKFSAFDDTFNSNFSRFDSCFQNLHDQFGTIENTVNTNFDRFKSGIQTVADQFSIIETKSDLDQIKLYVQSFNNKIISISEILEALKENGFAIDINKIETLDKKLDILAQVDPCEIVNVFIEESKKSLDEITNLRNSLEQKLLNIDEYSSEIEFLNSNITALTEESRRFPDEIINLRNSLEQKLLNIDENSSKEELREIQSKIEFLNSNILALIEESEKFPNEITNLKNSFEQKFQNIDENSSKIEFLNSNILALIEESEKFPIQIANLKNSLEQKLQNIDENSSKEDLQEVQNKIEFLNSNILALIEESEKFPNEIANLKNSLEQKLQNINENSSEKELQEVQSKIEVNEKLNYILDETKSFSNKISDEFSSLTAPLSSAIELTCGLKDSIDELLSSDDIKVKKETSQLLENFENLYTNTETNFEHIFYEAKLFYEKLEEVKNEFSNISYDTNSKITDFVSKAEIIDLKLEHNLSNSENSVSVLKNISEFAENQINLTSERLNSLKTDVSALSKDFDLFKNDITEVSSKINKIILNEKENTISLNTSFNDLKEELNKNFELNTENSNQADKKIIEKFSEEFKKINNKIDKTEEISSKTLETSDEMKSAIAYMAEWFDTAGKLLEENNQVLKKNSIEKAESFIKKSEENLTEQIKRISDKLNRFEIKMESIEGRVEKLSEQKSNREILILLKDIQEKIELSEERSKSNELILLSKLEKLESKPEKVKNKKTGLSD